MNTRERLEKREYMILSDKAAKADQSRGRLIDEDRCTMRTDFQRDRDRIVHSKSFRRLMHKTQVFLAPEGDHFRTRLTHTLEVAQVARTIARGLGLNEDLTEAVALGHDLGHTPFGHNGEVVIAKLHKGGFRHNEQSLRVVDVLEWHNNSRGMNLTAEVRDGILNHTGPIKPFTLEGQIVRISDRIAYINHDIDDALRSGVITFNDLPKECIEALGDSHGKRIDTLVEDLIENSMGQTEIRQGYTCTMYMNELRNYMFENVYHSEKVKKTEELLKVESIIESLYNYYLERPEELPQDMFEHLETYDTDDMVKDYVAGMTDRYSINCYNRIFGKNIDIN